jgi:hypothetical protein
MRRLGWILALMAASGLWSAQARAVPQAVTGGSSTFTFTVDLDALDVDVSANGSAEMTAPGVFVMPITSGVVDLAAVAGSIQHEGSGLEFDFGGISVDADNLEFDFDDRMVNGDLSAGPLELHTGIFDIIVCSEGGCVGPGGTVPTTGYGLFLRPQAADFFENDVFGDVVFDDEDQILYAQTQPTFAGGVPEPGLSTLLGVGMLPLLTGVALRRSKAAAR